MKAFVKYAAVLASGLAVGFYLREPLNLEKFVKPPSFAQIDVFIRGALAAAKPKAPVDPAAAARVDEELDFRIAQHAKSIEGWRAFLAAHASGDLARTAKAEMDRLLAAGTVSPQPPAEVGASPGAPLDRAPLAEAGPDSVHANPPPAGAQVASLNADNYRMTTPAAAAASKPAPEEEPATEDGRPSEAGAQAGPLARDEAGGGDSPASRPYSASAPLNVAAKATGAPAQRRRAAPWLAPVYPHVSARGRRANHCSRSACYWRHMDLPPILMALFGEKPLHAGEPARTWITDRRSPMRGR